MRTMRTLPILLSVSAVALAYGAPPARCQSAQTPTSATTISVHSNLVNLPVTVRDKKGRVVQNLTKADFDLKVDDRDHVIQYFSLDTNLPLTLALDVDTSKSVQGMLDAERTASDSFLTQMLTTPSDKAAVLHFDREVELLEDLTTNKSALTNALDQLGPTPAPKDADDPDQNRHGGTALYDSIYLAAHDVLANKPGRKAIVVLSDGEDRGSQETLREAIEAAERSEVVIYTIYFKSDQESYGMGPHDNGYPGHHGGMGYPGGGGMGYPGGGYPGGGYPRGGGNRRQPVPHIDGKKIMEQLAGETGGDFFEVKKKENYADVYKQIADELRTQYLLGFTPTPSESTTSLHTIQLRTHKGDQDVLTRAGYYGKGGDPSDK